ncbi:hypothetical protein HDV00_001667 [Rhizophlyctis rosea]|nr:hypothetical protein HDV00_001667 [Rhizophlyctis rosea]
MSLKDFKDSIGKYYQTSMKEKDLPHGNQLLKEYSPWLSAYQGHRYEEGGEDLRLDQRVQQLFTIMNSLMTKSGYLVQHQISLGTYKDMEVANAKHQEVVNQAAKGLKARHTIGDEYGNLFKVRREQIVEHMNKLWNQMSKPYLRMFMQKLASSPEAFLTLRKEFSRSFGALNICSYLLGIGDRHLENFLVDMKSGRVIAIDFGHAFGSATEVLPVPELVPFRLTKQMIMFMQPLGIQGLMMHPMVQVMAAMQEGKDALLNAMDIFIKEPLMEWRKFAISQAQKQGRGKGSQSIDIDQSSITAPEWYPQQKLDIARLKLSGENPAYLTAQELEWGHRDKMWFKDAKSVLMGDARIDRRAQVGKRCKDVKEQVECLIDQATDPSILGRAWRGWSAWS